TPATPSAPPPGPGHCHDPPAARHAAHDHRRPHRGRPPPIQPADQRPHGRAGGPCPCAAKTSPKDGRRQPPASNPPSRSRAAAARLVGDTTGRGHTTRVLGAYPCVTATIPLA